MEKYDARLVSRAVQHLALNDVDSLSALQQYVIISSEERIETEEERQRKILTSDITDDEVIPIIESRLRRLNELPFAQQQSKKRQMLLGIEKYFLYQEREKNASAKNRKSILAEETIARGSGVSRGTIRSEGFWQAYIEDASKNLVDKLPSTVNKAKDEEIATLREMVGGLLKRDKEYVQNKLELDELRKKASIQDQIDRNSMNNAVELSEQLRKVQAALGEVKAENEKLKRSNRDLKVKINEMKLKGRQ